MLANIQTIKNIKVDLFNIYMKIEKLPCGNRTLGLTAIQSGYTVVSLSPASDHTFPSFVAKT